MDTYAIPPTVYHYRDWPWLTTALRSALWIDVFVSAVVLVTALAGTSLPVAAKLGGAVSSLWMLVFAVTWILLFIWIYRAAANVYAMGADVSFDPPWAVGWFLVPIVNIWMPFVVIEEIWRGSIDAARWKGHHVSWIAIYWWGAWVAGWLGALLWMLGGGGVIAKTVFFAAHIAHAYLMLPIVERIRELQQTQAASRGIA